MPDRILRAGRTAWAILGIAGVVAVLGLIAWYLRIVLPPLLLAGALTFVLNPVVTGLQRRGLPRAVGTGLAYLAVVGIAALAVALVVPLAASQAGDLRAELPQIEDRVGDFIDERAAASTGTFYEFTRSDLEEAFSGGDATLTEQLTQLREVGVRIFEVLLIIVLAPILAFYLLVDLPHIRTVTESLIPAAARDEVFVLGRRLNRAIGGFFRGQLAVALIVGVLCSIGLAVIGLKFWFIIGMIAGLFNVIPLIGPWIGGLPGVAIALTTGTPLQALLVIAVMVGAQQIDNHLITPYVMQRAVSLHPAVVVLALLAGGSLFGFLGLLLAVPATAVLKILLSHAWRIHVLGEPLEEAAVEQAVDDAGPSDGLVAEVVDVDGDGAPSPGQQPK